MMDKSERVLRILPKHRLQLACRKVGGYRLGEGPQILKTSVRSNNGEIEFYLTPLLSARFEESKVKESRMRELIAQAFKSFTVEINRKKEEVVDLLEMSNLSPEELVTLKEITQHQPQRGAMLKKHARNANINFCLED